MPSEKVLLQKQEKVNALTDMLKKSVAGVIVDYKGINVADDTKLRKELREAGVHYTVEKNSLLRFAFKNAGMDGLVDVLKGTTAIALSNDDQTAPARILGKFIENDKSDDKADKFSLKAGFVDGEIYDANGVMALSKIPSKEVLLSQLVGSLQGPMQGLAAILKAVQEKKATEEAA